MDMINFTRNDAGIIRLMGRFDYLARREFTGTVAQAVADSAVNSILIDLGAVDDIDCSALSLLLVCRDVAKRAGKTVSLLNPTGDVKRALDAAHFAALFAIESTFELA